MRQHNDPLEGLVLLANPPNINSKIGQLLFDAGLYLEDSILHDYFD